MKDDSDTPAEIQPKTAPVHIQSIFWSHFRFATVMSDDYSCI